jgi:hypothetical protein
MPGFDFSNHTRNAALHARGVPLPKATSTGTTIVGCIFEGGVVVCGTLDELGSSSLCFHCTGLCVHESYSLSFERYTDPHF